MNKILFLRKDQKLKKMLLVILIIGILSGALIWNYFIDGVSRLDALIPPPENISFNQENPKLISTKEIAEFLHDSKGKPALIYLYTTWCKQCSNNFSIINEIAREFQNTDLRFMAIAIDRDLDQSHLKDYLSSHNSIFFSSKILVSKEGFKDLMKSIDVEYNGRIPFTIILDKEGRVVTKFSGIRSKSFLHNKIVRELYL